MRWKRITLVGVGLLGGSLGLALKRRRLADEVAGYVRRAASIAECEETGAVDLASRDLRQVVEGADVVILCTPLAQMRPLMEQILPVLKPGAVVTDVGSVKDSVVRELEPLAARAGGHFVGSHPMAGSEKAGVRAASGDLFVNAVCMVTPTRNSNPGAVRTVERLWRSVGGRLLTLSPAAHDELAARSSHLPYMLATELANFVLAPGRPSAQALVCANGFRDTTRIASGSPEMWRDIVLANRKNLSRGIGSFISDLQRLRRLLGGKNAKALLAFFEQAKRRRDSWAGEMEAWSAK